MFSTSLTCSLILLFVVFTTQKYALMKLVKDYNERMNATISEIKMPNLEKYLSSKFAFSSNQSDNICKYCEKFIPKSLLKHYRYCSAKREFDMANGIQPDPAELVDEEIEVQIPVVEIPFERSEVRVSTLLEYLNYGKNA